MAAFAVGTYQLAPHFYLRYMLPEGYGLIEVSHFFIPLFGLFIAASLLLLPFVRARPVVFTVALIAALSCLYIAGEEMSWGQHFFHWNTPEYWAMVNRQEETNLHNTYAIFEKTPRSILELGIFIGGLIVPIAAMFYPWLRACRASLFLPADALVPTALGAFAFKLLDRLQQGGYVDDHPETAERDHRDLSLFLHPGLSDRLCPAPQGARSGRRRAAEMT